MIVIHDVLVELLSHILDRPFYAYFVAKLLYNLGFNGFHKRLSDKLHFFGF